MVKLSDLGYDADLDLLVLSKEKGKFQHPLIPNKIHQINLSEDFFKKALNEKEL